MTTQNPRVLLLNPFADVCTEADAHDRFANQHITRATPLGIAYIYTYAKARLRHLDFRICDAQAILYRHASRGMEYCWSLLREDLLSARSQVVGIGGYFYRASSLFHKTCALVKEVLPSTTIVVGGNYPTDATTVVMQDPNVDFAVLSEGEATFVEFLTRHFSDLDITEIDDFAYRDTAGCVRVNKKAAYISDLSTLPIPDRSVLSMSLYGRGRSPLQRIFDDYRALDITISRGCPYACTFCTAKNFWGRKLRYSDPDSVLSEMQMLKEEYGADVLLVNDDNFMADKRRCGEILRGMISRKLNLRWINNGGSNVRSLSDDSFLDLVIESGCCLFDLAIESGSNATLARIAKPVSVAESISVVKKIRERCPDAYIKGYFIVGFPFETRADIRRTFDFSEVLELDWASHYIFKPLPNTELADSLLEDGILDSIDFDYDQNYFESHIDGVDWTSEWLYEENYKAGLRINFLQNTNLRAGNHRQAIRDFEYTIGVRGDHALAYKQAATASQMLGDTGKARTYATMEIESLRKDNVWSGWYEKLGLSS